MHDNDNHANGNKTNGNNNTTTATMKYASSQSRGPTTLAICAVGICTCYLYYGVLQEQFFADATMGATFLLVSQACTNTLVALLWQRITLVLLPWSRHSQNSQDARRLHHPLLILTALCYFVAMTASNESLRYVSYPTAVLAKSCKLIPTMILGWLVENRRYARQDWWGAACITGGIVLFNLSRLQPTTHGRGNDSLYGIGLLALSLFMDGLLGACQGLLKVDHGTKHDLATTTTTTTMKTEYRPPSATETMLFVNLYATAFLLPLAVYSGQWSQGVRVLVQQPSARKGMVLLNAAAAMGQIFIFLTIYWYSSLVCTTITTTRKFFTILLSVLHFGHVFTLTQWLSVIMVFTGLYSGIMTKARSAMNDSKLQTKSE